MSGMSHENTACCFKSPCSYVMEKCVLELAIPVEDGVMSAQTNREISDLVCHVCDITQESENKLKSHIKNKHRIVECRTCGKIIFAPNSREHGDSCPPKEVLKCQSCHYTTTKPRLLKSHELSHKRRKENCKFCNKTFLNYSSLSKHVLRNHGNQNKIQCHYCTGVFSSLRSRDLHIKTKHLEDHGIVYLKCNMAPCTFFCKTSGEMNSHMRWHRQKSPGPHICRNCKKAFKRKRCPVRYYLMLVQAARFLQVSA